MFVSDDIPFNIHHPSKAAIFKTGLFSAVVTTFLGLGMSDLNQPGNTHRQNLISVVVNELWFLSLVFSLTSALYATLIQQWTRRYLELTKRRVAPHRRARIRGYMFSGISTFKMPLAVKLMPVLLHFSIFSFFAGLVVYIWNIKSVVGYCVLGLILVFTIGYIVLTILPYLYLNSPYSTPFSDFACQAIQILLYITFSLINKLFDLISFIGVCLPRKPTDQSNDFASKLTPSRWSQLEKTIRTRSKTYQEWLKNGLWQRIMESATDAPSDMDKSALAWTLTVLDDDREFEDFVARVPGFFESAYVPEASSTMLSLMDIHDFHGAQSKKFDPILGSCINDLLKSCVPGTSPLRDELRRNRLRICLRTLWCFAREYNLRGITTPLPSYIRATFANPEMTRQIRSEADLTARIIGCCFNSLIVKKVAEGVHSRTDRGPDDMMAELSCLAAILGKTSGEVVSLLSQPGAISLANIISVTSSDITALVKEEVPSEVLDIFLKTLDILFAEEPLAPPNAELPRHLVAAFDEASPLGRRLRTPDLRMDRLKQALEKLSVSHVEPEVIMPEPEPWFGSSSTTSSTIALGGYSKG